MTLLRLTFMFCLLCFTAKQSGLIVKASEKSKITHESIDDDCEENEEEPEKSKFEELLESAHLKATAIPVFLKKRLTFPTLHFSYKEYLNFSVSPPPDFV